MSAGSRTPVTKLLAGLAVLLVCATAMVVTTAPRAEAATSFRGWQFTPQVSATRFDGMALNDVSYNGVFLFERLSFPAMNVFYDNNACGPYVDRIGGSSYTPEGPTEFTQDGVRWLQIGLTDQIGAYVITQMFYLSENGDLDAHIFSKGLQCNIRHDHIPFWRLDFDIAGPSNDQIRRATAGGPVAMTNEFSMSATAAVDHGWEVHDTVTGDFVTIDFDDGSFGLAGETVVPETDYVENNVYGRQFKAIEQTWQGGATYGLFGDENEPITDAVLWYNGFLPHAPEDGPSLWHSTGIRMRVNPATQQQASIAGLVRNGAGAGVGQVGVDLFTQNRASYVTSTTTDGSGNFGFDVDPGCYVLTFVAPTGTTFGGGGQYLNSPVCVGAGQSAGGNDATLISPGGGAASVGDRVTYGDGSAASGVKIDLFSENRAQYIGSTVTDGDGYYSFDLATAQCGVVTFIAPTGGSFVATGTGYQDRSFCVSNGENLTTIDAVLAASGSQATLGDRVTNASNGSGVPNVLLVLYQANGDGSRGQYLRSALTNAAGNYGFAIPSGCYVIDFVAPSGRTWVSTGGVYQQLARCVAAGAVDNSLDGVLN